MTVAFASVYPPMRATGITRTAFLRAVVIPVLPPVLAQSKVLVAELRAGMGPFMTILFGGGGIGLLAFVLVGLWTAIPVAELRKLRSEFRPVSRGST